MIASLRDIWRRWGTKAALSIADQGFFSGANFALNILLARWLGQVEYGAFAVAFAVFLFGSGFHNALILEPMAVLGASREEADLPAYLGRLVWLHVALTVPVGLLLVAVGGGLAWAGSAAGPALTAAGWTSPALLLHWLGRRACYLRMRPHLAAWSSGGYAVGMVGGVFALSSLGWLTEATAFGLMGVLSLLVGGMLLAALGVSRGDVRWVSVAGHLKPLLRENWQYGRWISGSVFVSWLSTTLYLPLVGSMLGLAQAAAFRAMQNLVQPLQQILVALNLLWLPWFSRQHTQDAGYLRRAFPKALLADLGVAGAYVAALWIGGETIVSFLYGDGAYLDHVALLYYFGVFMIVMAGREALAVVLRAKERPDAIFTSQAVGTGITLTAGLYLVWRFGTVGAVVSMILVALAAVLVLAWVWRTAGARPDAPEESDEMLEQTSA